MAIRVYRVAVVGCPRAVISQEASEGEGTFQGVGKSCLCNRFVRPEAYSETEHSSIMNKERWIKNSVFNGDHFVYWGAANKHLHDGTKVRFQVVEHTEIYDEPSSNGGRLVALPSSQDYLDRASSLHFQSRTPGKEAYRLKATDEATKRTRGPVRTRQLFPNEDFGGNGGKKTVGIYGYVCVFDPTLEDAQMQKQLNYLSTLLPLLKKRKLIIACVKCDIVDEVKIRFGANLAAYVLKKAIPFIEVSARDSVNVEDAFFSLVSPPKKSKSSKSKRSSPYLTYDEVILSRKGDLNRAKDGYRKLLQRKVKDFTCQWSQVQPELLNEPDYQAVVTLVTNEAPEELVKKMFQQHLIEIKLLEANKKFGSTVKKANKDRSSAQQIYLSEALRSHPDLGTDSMYDYVYSPGHSIAGDTDIGDTEEQLTEPSTPSSTYHPTPDLHGSILSDLCDNLAPPQIAVAVSPHPRSATVPDMLVTVPSVNTSTLPPQSSKDSVLSPKMSTSLPRQPFTFANEKEPPPLPPRDMATVGTLKKNKQTTQSQPFLENTAKQPGTLKREAEARRLSNSMDCLLLPEEDAETSQSGNSFDKLEAEPYLRPSDVIKVMGASTQPVAARNSSLFMSMRVAGKTRPQLPNFQDFTDATESMKRSKSFERGHKRSQSNPFVLELLAGGTAVPPELPPRNTEYPPPPVPSRRSPQLRASRSPPPLPPPSAGAAGGEESSLEFGNTAPGGRLSLQSGRISRTRSPQAVVRDLKEHTFKELEEDNISTISGPFEEIDFDQTSVATEQSGMARDSSTHTLPSQNEKEDAENDQYARIEDITQQYIAMAPAPANVKGATLPVQRGSYLSGDDLEEEEGAGKRAKSMSQTPAPPATPKKDPGVIARTVRRFRKQRTEPIVRESTDSPSPPPNSIASSVSSSLLASPNRHSLPRPLPPSPTKGVKGQFNSSLRKHSNGSGSNIYETIDEDLFNRVMNGRPRRGGSTKYDTGKDGSSALPVDRSMWPKYLQVIQKFFSLPEIQAKWVEVVREVMPNEDAEDIPPPYYNTASEKGEAIDGGEGEGEGKRAFSRIKTTGSHQDDDQIPIHVPQPSSSSSPLLTSASGMRSTPLVVSPQSPFQSPRHPRQVMASKAAVASGGSPLTNSPVVKRQTSRDGLIELMNQQLRHNHDSSDSETDSDEEAGMDDEEASSDSDLTDYDSDAEQSRVQPSKLPDGGRMLVTPHTDLDEVLGTHNCVSTDSDHIESDPVIKSPQSASVEELAPTNRQEVGVVEDNCVKPSQFLSELRRKQSVSEIKTGAGGTRSLSDSGISNQNFEENIQSETEC